MFAPFACCCDPSTGHSEWLLLVRFPLDWKGTAHSEYCCGSTQNIHGARWRAGHSKGADGGQASRLCGACARTAFNLQAILFSEAPTPHPNQWTLCIGIILAAICPDTHFEWPVCCPRTLRLLHGYVHLLQVRMRGLPYTATAVDGAPGLEVGMCAVRAVPLATVCATPPPVRRVVC
jgi:hypothetical protein